MLYLFEKIDLLEDDFIENVLSLLSEERKIKISKLQTPMNKNASAAAYLLLRIALSYEYLINKAVTFDYKEHGKPFLVGYPGIYFNLSHSHTTAACVVAETETGVDVQHITSVSDKVARRVLTEDEYSLFCKSSEPDDYFCEVWAIKESFIKKTGLGLSYELRDITAEDISDKQIIKGDNYYCCVCGPKMQIKYIGREDIERLHIG